MTEKIMDYEEMATEVRNFKIMSKNIEKVMVAAPDMTKMRETMVFLLKYYKESRGKTLHQAIECISAGGTVWLKDYADDNYGSEDDPHYHYPIEDLEDLICRIEENEDEIATIVRFSLEDCFEGDE